MPIKGPGLSDRQESLSRSAAVSTLLTSLRTRENGSARIDELSAIREQAGARALGKADTLTVDELLGLQGPDGDVYRTAGHEAIIAALNPQEQADFNRHLEAVRRRVLANQNS